MKSRKGGGNERLAKPMALSLADKYEIEGFLGDHRFAQELWCRLAATELRSLHARYAELEKDAARYRFLRDTCWSSDKELATVISLQMNKVWDEKIDEAMARNKKE